MNTYRIHGDNIVECERIVKIIVNTLRPKKIHTSLISPSTIAIEFKTVYARTSVDWRLELLPGFNKNKKKRWEGNIFDALKEAGSYFDETPDIVISKLNDHTEEKILLSIEFCSALQAGNQAWQRSARAFSVGRTGCPYIYVVDIGKYELDKKTRERKNVRLPNTAVAYSYVNYSKTTGNLVTQLYTKSEEFDRQKESTLKDFDEDNFGTKELGVYIIKLMLGESTSNEEACLLDKNMNVIRFLSQRTDSKKNFTDIEWAEIHDLDTGDIIDFAVNKRRFGFHKTVTAKGQHGQSAKIVKLMDKYGIGFASKELPFGIISANDRPAFAKEISKIYSTINTDIINSIGSTDKHLVVALFKGFKPKGDDARPDRGLLPFAAMLSSCDVDVMSYIYGPIIERNLLLLDSEPYKLAERNGLWRSILSLNNFVLIDAPVLSKVGYDVVRLFETTDIKKHYNSLGVGKSIMPKPIFSNTPVNYTEDDVDTGIHYLFTHVLGKICFEGMCNPPGGDWSGFSIIDKKGFENRWVSLPRESKFIEGKRPDHILQISNVFKKPLLLSIESKEKSFDLEKDVGIALITYIKKLLDFVPSAKRKLCPCCNLNWKWGDERVDFNDFEVVSAAAYLRKYAQPTEKVLQKKCEMLFIMDPIFTERKIGWEIEIIPSTERSKIIKDFIVKKYKATGDNQFVFK